MLAKINRFSKKKEIEEVLARGKSHGDEGWLVKYLKKEDKEKKFAVVVSKKISKKAVVRNRIRRKIYEGVRQNLEKMSPGIRAVFLVNSRILKKIDEKGGVEVPVIL